MTGRFAMVDAPFPVKGSPPGCQHLLRHSTTRVPDGHSERGVALVFRSRRGTVAGRSDQAPVHIQRDGHQFPQPHPGFTYVPFIIAYSSCMSPALFHNITMGYLNAICCCIITLYTLNILCYAVLCNHICCDSCNRIVTGIDSI